MESRIPEREFIVRGVNGGFTELTFQYDKQWLRWGISRREAATLAMDLLDALNISEAVYGQVVKELDK